MLLYSCFISSYNMSFLECQGFIGLVLQGKKRKGIGHNVSLDCMVESKGSKKIKVSKRVWYTPNTTGLEEKDGTDGGVEGSVDQDSQTTQRKCTSSVSGTHGQGIGPRWGKPRRTEVGLESQNDPQRDA